MADMTLDKVWEAVQALTPDEQWQLREQLNRALAQQEEAAKMEAFHQVLLASRLAKCCIIWRG